MSKNLLSKIWLVSVTLILALQLAACNDSVTPTSSSKTNSSTTQANTTKLPLTEQIKPSQTIAPMPTITVTPPLVTVIDPNLKANLTIWSDLIKGDTEGIQSQLLTDQVQQFMQAYPGIKVNVVDFNPDEIVTDFQNAVTTGDGPDLILSPSNNVTSLVAAKAAQPIDNLINAQQYATNALAPSNFNGKQYGVPYIYGNSVVMLYNKRLVPTPPTDTKQLIAMAQKINQMNSSYIGMSLDINEPANLASWLYAYSGSLFDAQGQPNLNIVAMQQTLIFFQLLERDRVVAINNDPSENTYDYAFRDGRLGFYFTTDTNALNYLVNPSSYGNANQNNKLAVQGVGLDLGIAPMPKLSDTGKNPSPFTNSEAMFVNATINDASLEAIKAFFSFIATP